ncbi:MAG: ATPase [Chloroflexi bacterium]|nr:ATPase [Chloroflexota bacterium]
MLTKLRLERFKSFKEAELTMGPLTVLVGANASGKSNLRDAFRFLHGIGRGYSLAEILGEKRGEGGERVWRGIRGGTREVAFQGAKTFALEVMFTAVGEKKNQSFTYGIEVDTGSLLGIPRVAAEWLKVPGSKGFRFVSPLSEKPPEPEPEWRYSEIKPQGLEMASLSNIYFSTTQPFLSQILKFSPISYSVPLSPEVIENAERAVSVLSSMRFLDLDPDAMREPSLPGQDVLGDQGENLSSVLYDISRIRGRKAILVDWLQALTPMDAKKLEFPSGVDGKILATLVEGNGQKISALSASDGTLRFLGLLAALLTTRSAHLYFFEEIENGIHPTRLHLLIQLFEQSVKEKKIQVLATTHSPLLLSLLSQESREFASLTYRLEDSPDTRIQRLMEIPAARSVLERHDLAELFASGWMENTVDFMQDEQVMG